MRGSPVNTRKPRSNDERWHISPLGALLLGLAVVAAMIVGVAFSPGGFSTATTPVVVSILGICASTVPSVLALLKADEVHKDMHNGVITDKVREALDEEHRENIAEDQKSRADISEREADLRKGKK